MRLGIAGAVAAVALLGAPAGALASPTWLAPAGVSLTGGNAYTSQVAFDPSGDATAVWYRSISSSEYDVQAADRPAGGAWRTPATVSAPGATSGPPALGVDAQDTATTVFAHMGTSTTAIQAASRPRDGQWTPATTLSAPSTTANTRDPRVAVDSQGDAVAVWTSATTSLTIVQAASRPAGGDWQPPVTLSATTANANAQAVQVAIDAHGDAVAVWYRVASSGNGIVQAAVRPAGGAWHAPVDLSAVGLSSSFPEVAVDPAGDAVAVWQSFDGTTDAVRAARLPASSGVWQPSVALSPVGQEAESPQVTMDAGGRAVAVWMEATSSDTDVVGATASPAGAWSPVVQLSTPGEGGQIPQVAVGAGGDVAAVWKGYDGAHQIVQGAVLPAGAAAWGPAANVSPTGADTDQPVVAVDPRGDAVATWQGEVGIYGEIEAAGYDAAGPALTGLVVPATGVAGQPATFSVGALDAWSALGAVRWSFGDGASASGAVVTHAFAAPGTYAVTVTGTDALGNATSAGATIVVGAAVPVAAPGPSTSVAPPPGVPAPAPLTLTHAAQSHKDWRTAGKAPVGTRFSYILNRAATVSLTFARHRPGRRVKGKCVASTARTRKDPSCTRSVAAGTLTAKGTSGQNAISFKGTINHHHLTPGTYTLTLTATTPDHQRSRPATLNFTIVR